MQYDSSLRLQSRSVVSLQADSSVEACGSVDRLNLSPTNCRSFLCAFDHTYDTEVLDSQA